MKNINKEKKNIDPIAEARKEKYFKQYSKEAKERIRLGVEIYNSRKNLGINQENLIKHKLEHLFNTTLIKTDNYNTFDFYNKDQTIYIEVKSRKCLSNTYKTTLIPMSKYDYGDYIKKHNKNVKI